MDVTSRVLMTPVILLRTNRGIGNIIIYHIVLCGTGGGGHGTAVFMEAALAGAAPGRVVRVAAVLRISDPGWQCQRLGAQGISGLLPPQVGTARRRT